MIMSPFPANDAAAVTPSDSTAVSFRGLYIGTIGTVVLTTLAGNNVTFTNVVGILPVGCTKVLATGTTATGIVGLV